MRRRGVVVISEARAKIVSPRKIQREVQHQGTMAASEEPARAALDALE
jgi:hypothetical protein